jgi:hypothetical protein
MWIGFWKVCVGDIFPNCVSSNHFLMICDYITHKFVVIGFLCFYARSIAKHNFFVYFISCFGLRFLLFVCE